VLVAEDNPANQMVLVALLEKLGHTPRLVSSGSEALAACDEETFDLILLDVQMPEMDGPQTSARIRAEAGPNQRTPIVAVTAHVAPRDRESFLTSGIDEVLIKPILRHEFIRVLASLFPAGSSAVSAPEALTDKVGAGHVDLEAILVRLEGDRALLRDLIAVFHRDWPKWASELQNAVARADWPQVAFKAHRLRGLVRTFSAADADQAIAALEQAVQEGHVVDVASRWSAVAPLLHSLSQELQSIQEEISCTLKRRF